MTLLSELRAALGAEAVLTGSDCAPWSQDWTGAYRWQPLCVVRPRDTAGVSAVLRLAHAARQAVVPVSGNTGLTGGTSGDGAVLLSLDRMNAVREIRAASRIAFVEAGVILSDLHDAAETQGLRFPVTFGAKGSARIGGILATNAGGSNVLAFGNTRAQVLGIELVLADGRVMDLMSELHKDNSGYDLRDLVIGSEGTLGIITAAVLRLEPMPRATATALLTVRDFDAALRLLYRLQEVSDGGVEAFEYMSARHLTGYETLHGAPVPVSHDGVVVLAELASTAPSDAAPGADGQIPLRAMFESVLTDLMTEGLISDGALAGSEAQRRAFWAIREAAAEVATMRKPMLNHDIAVPLDKVAVFLDRMAARLAALDPKAEPVVVAHLGDGNVHYPVWPGSDDPAHLDAITEAVEDEVLRLGGSFSAEHGIGLAKRGSMARRKDPVALEVMRAIKSALDPHNILNPGKVLP